MTKKELINIIIGLNDDCSNIQYSIDNELWGMLKLHDWIDVIHKIVTYPEYYYRIIKKD